MRLIFVENGCSYPDQVVLTNANEYDRGQLEILIDDKECMYVFDRGYLDYERFALPENPSVQSDEMLIIGTSQNRSENVFRILQVLDSKGDQLNLLTIRFDLSADEIAELYKSRWAIELFFKWMKQHLNIKKFYGKSQQSVHNQVYIAMIVYCLNVLAQLKTNSKRTYLQISRYLKASLWKSACIWLRKIEEKSVP